MKKYKEGADLSETAQTRMTRAQFDMVNSAAQAKGLTLAAFIRMSSIEAAQGVARGGAPVQITRNDGGQGND